MNNVRRAFLLATGERYLVLVINLLMLALMSRLLSAREIGIATVGLAVLAMAQAVRDFGTITYLVQRPELSTDVIRSAFTVTLLNAMALAILIGVFANAYATFYREEALAAFLQVIALSLLVGTMFGPSGALLQRELAFGTLAVIHTVGAVANAWLAIGLAVLGAGAMSLAWSAVAHSLLVACLAVYLRPVPGAFRPSLEHWREVVGFGSMASAAVLISRLNESLPSLVLGRLQPLSAVGYFNRATMVCELPLKGLLGGIAPVALPALAKTARDGHHLGEAYLRALAFITAVQWPALLLVALLAHPIVIVLLGPQWTSVVPLVQIMAVAGLFAAPSPLMFPMLASLGAVRVALLLGLFMLPLTAAVFVVAAQYSVTAAAFGLLIITPLQNAAGVLAVRRRAEFGWSELAAALRPSVAISGATVGGPLVVLLVAGSQMHGSIGLWFIAALLGALGWFAGLAWQEHPLLGHVTELAGKLHRAWLASSLMRWLAHARDVASNSRTL